MRWRSSLFLLTAGALLAALGSTAYADSVSGELFYTTYAGSPNVHSVSFSYDGAATFSLGAITDIGTTPGADGISGNPKNSDLLIVGGQGTDVSTISKTTGTVTTLSGLPYAVYHLEVSDADTLYGAAIPGGLVKMDIGPGGALSSPVAVMLSGSNTTITQLITTPTGYFYTSSGSGGFGTFGTLSFTDATHATTTAIASGVAAAHGGVYDPFSGTVIIMGDSTIQQYSLAGTLIGTRSVAGFGTLDQGTVDGEGHLYVASNSGYLVFLDYAADGEIATGSHFIAAPYLQPYLDDVAPLVGGGSTQLNTVPLPPAFFAGLGLMGLGAIRRRLRRRRARA